MPTNELTDDQRRAHFSELGNRAVESRRRRKAAVALIITETRRTQNLPADLPDVEVLDHAVEVIRNASDGVEADPTVERLLDQAEAQGLPRHVTDRDALAKIATILRHAGKS